MHRVAQDCIGLMWGFALYYRALRSIKHMIANDQKGIMAVALSATCTLQTKDEATDGGLFLFVSNGLSEATRHSEPGLLAEIGL